MSPSVLAIAAHPDDIEFTMSGTLLRLIELGWNAHYFNIANGCCGTQTMTVEECAAVRLQEAQAAAKLLSAEFHPPICNDLEIFYDKPTMAKVSALVRRVKPQIILTHAMSDYMEDHQNTARLAVFAAFSRGMPNWTSSPKEQTFFEDIAVYHAQPHGNRTPTNQPVTPEFFIDTSDLMSRKRKLLECHASQNTWLDESQGMSSYLQTMSDLNAEVGQMSGRFEFAEGWTQHLHLGLAARTEFDPLGESLSHCRLRLKS